MPGPEGAGEAASTSGSAVMVPELTSYALLALLVRRRRGRLQLLLDSRHVRRVLQVLLEEPPLALARGRAERGRLLVGHVEDHVLRRRDRRGGCPRRRVRVDARRHVLVAGGEAALGRPRSRGGGGREELHERLDRRGVTERDDRVAADLDRRRGAVDRWEGELAVLARLRLHRLHAR